MLRNICATYRNFGQMYKNSLRNLIFNNPGIRSKSIAIAKSQKKEPAEPIKWILLMIPVTSFGLGTWQVQRLQWKLDLISALRGKTNSAVVDLPLDLDEIEKMEYKPVRIRGEFLHEKEFLIGPRSLIEPESLNMTRGSLVSDPKKNQGWLVVTPFRLKDSGAVILVNRGWIPSSERPKERRAPSLLQGEVELTGVVRLTEKRAQFMPKNNPEKGSWLYRDLAEMSAHAGSLPVWLDARGVPDPPAGWPRPNQTRVTLRNEHLSYVVTWYMLSALTALMWHRHFVKKLPLV